MKPFRVLVAAMAVVLVLSGCSVVKTVSTGLAKASTPRVGSCWSEKPQDAFFVPTSVGTPVPCSSRHDAYTFAVASLPVDLTSATWAVPSAATGVSTIVTAAAEKACYTKQVLSMGTLDADMESRFAYTFHLPTVSDWRNGAHWVRCDYSLFSFGTTLWEPGFESLPTSHKALLAEIVDNEKKFFLCLDTAGTATAASDPLRDHAARYADCSGTPRWSEEETDYFPQGDGAPYPGDDAALAYETQSCQDAVKAGQVLVPYGPTPASWATDDRWIECWVADAEPGDGS